MTTQSASSERPAAGPHQEMISGPYLRNAWYVAAWSDDIGDGQLVARRIMDARRHAKAASVATVAARVSGDGVETVLQAGSGGRVVEHARAVFVGSGVSSPAAGYLGAPAAISGAINDAVRSLGISFNKLPIRIAAISDAVAAARAAKVTSA